MAKPIIAGFSSDSMVTLWQKWMITVDKRRSLFGIACDIADCNG